MRSTHTHTHTHREREREERECMSRWQRGFADDQQQGAIVYTSAALWYVLRLPCFLLCVLYCPRIFISVYFFRNSITTFRFLNSCAYCHLCVLFLILLLRVQDGSTSIVRMSTFSAFLSDISFTPSFQTQYIGGIDIYFSFILVHLSSLPPVKYSSISINIRRISIYLSIYLSI